jgi:hypothetical protein
MKRYLAIICRKTAGTLTDAMLVAGYERGGKVFEQGKFIGYAVDYYPDEERAYRKQYSKSVHGDYATREEAHSAIQSWFDEHSK